MRYTVLLWILQIAWSEHTDWNGATVRVVLFDFRKAFDLINHGLLGKKLENLDLPLGFVSRVIDFLKNWKQRAKLSQDCFSDWSAVPAGVAQAKKLRSCGFPSLNNDINADKLDLCGKLFSKVVSSPEHKLHKLLNTRNEYKLILGLSKFLM